MAGKITGDRIRLPERPAGALQDRQQQVRIERPEAFGLPRRHGFGKFKHDLGLQIPRDSNRQARIGIAAEVELHAVALRWCTS
ncbi:hypothetical protein D9M68_463530 [compost metagenome]